MSMFEEQEYSKRLDFTVWKKLLRYTLPYKKYLIFLMFQMMIISGIDAVFPMFTKIAIDRFITPNTFSGFPVFCILVFSVIIVQTVNNKVMIMIAGKIETGVPYSIRKEAFLKLQNLSLSYYDKTPTGWLMARMTSDIRRLGHTLSWNLVDMAWVVTMMFLTIVIMLILNWKLALLVIVTTPFLALVSFVFQYWILNNYRKVRKINSHVVNAFNEGIMGAKTIKTLVREGQCLEEFKELTLDMRKYAVKSAALSSIYTPVVMMLGSIGTAAIIWRGGSGVIAGGLSYGTFVAFLSYAAQFFEPVKQFARIFSDFQYAQASAERVMTLIETQADIEDSEKVINEYGIDNGRKNGSWPELKGSIKFENVSFSYKDGESVLSNFNMEIKPGETIALVGETGAGKTTIVNLACRFYEPTEGKILIDGVDYRERPLLWLHTNLGFVLQEPHLFSGSVRDNIAYTRTEATIEEITRTAKLVNAHDFIARLEKGYDTDVGERGGRLSTGQKQLISFARAILADPCIFVLDEATSSVDTESEHLIKEAIKKILTGRTSIIIAHRLSTIRSADRILVIEKGAIIEEGTHRELLARRGYYYRMYASQFIEEQETMIMEKTG